MDNAKRRMRVAFEFMSKLGVSYWSFHDRLVEKFLAKYRELEER